MYSGALNKFSEYLQETSEDKYIEKDLDDILDDENITETEKKRLIKSRIGQGEFRSRLISHWKGCSVTRYSNIKLLMASHIKPWKESDNEERLDVHNGLLLLPNLDKAFNKGYITFRESGVIRISEYFNEASLFGVLDDMKIEGLGEDHQTFLRFHRENVFMDK